MNLFWKLFASFGIAMAVTLAGTVYVSFRIADQAFDQLNFQGRQPIIQEAAEALAAGGEHGLRFWLLRNPFPTPGMALLVIDERGNELLGRPPPRHVVKLLRKEAFRQGRRPSNVRPAQPTPEIVGPDGKVYSLVFARMPVTFLGMWTWPGTQLAVLTIALIAAALTSLLLARYLSSPIGRLQKATRALAAGALETRVGPPVSKRRDEAGRLARDFDTMAERLQALVTDKEVLLRDVSHEFRSPLARIQVALALAQRRAGDAAQGDLARIQRETEQLNELVGQVMTLTRLRTETEPRQVPVVLPDLVDQVVADARFEHPHTDIRFTGTQVPAVLGDPAGLKSAIENVLRNALSHAGAEKPVTIVVDATPKDVTVHVLDEGPGVPADATERIFEPFFRLDESRDHQSDGQGIGLAIAARVMELHGGSATASNRPEGGLEVALTVPIERPQNDQRS